ncbi:TPA: hypothetical protein P1M42_000132 [Clostridioides difficile]|uniref:Uncharacterized protein n=3 Tax=Clostridioides difficile TaxID=1496 RepID=A0ACA7UNP5_CLODI|nr:hypothetical protein [Clostridioides difficile]YP_009221666.1 hypothetical protein PHICD211_20066 [Clostridium phage phiCD211]AKP44743.1 hypothetical protein CDIF1296T_phi069 [Peptoclostridium phage phiCDIF1296T]AUO78460.1 hypothetical protein LIBA2945_00070 [Clostridioides phage LIBA2945]WMU95167.1 hypothetical protein ADOKEBJH_00071 [Clostridioides phage AR1086-1]CCL67097.1 hypothetical protein BN183_3830040 [Clostridioides difficile E7]ARC16999.1 hypothetical protein A6J95_19775 [Clostr
MSIFNKKYGRNVKITEEEPPSPPPKQPIYNRDNIQYDKEMERKLLDIDRLKIELEKEKKIEEERKKVERVKENEGKEWAWVEGYKCTDKNMKCKEFQYELNKAYSMDGDDINIWNWGFHLCLDLGDVFQYYAPNLSNRFFKVKALVKKADKYKYGKEYGEVTLLSGSVLRGHKINKIAAKEIIFLEELTFDKLKLHIQNSFPEVNTKSKWYAICKLGEQEYYHRMFMNQMKKIRFSDTFSQLLFDECRNYCEILEILNKAIAYSKENLSKDMIIYLLMKDIRK